jgi:cytoskeletal protein RodZ
MSQDDMFQNIDTDKDPSPSVQPQPSHKHGHKRSGHKVLVMTIIIVVLLAAAAGYWFLKYHSKPTSVTTTTSTSTAGEVKTQSVTPPVSATEVAPANTTQYTSTQSNLNLSFDYPTDWTVSPKQTSASATTPITVTSPSVSIATADGTTVTGKVIVTIRAGGAAIGELSTTAVAAQDSVQMAYTHPTATQRQYPYLTFVHFSSGSKTDGAFEEVIVTGGDQFTKNDSITSDGLGNVDPLITASFYSCDAADCSTPSVGTLAISNTIWQNAALFQTTATLFASFKLN